MRYEIAALHGSYLTLSYDRATVGDAMRAGVFACEPSDSLREVARIMATHHVHCVPVSAGEGRIEGVVSDLDVLRAATAGSELTAAEVAGRDIVTAVPEERLSDAARRMADAGATHAIVLRDGGPVGVLSSLDVAGILAWGEA